MSFIPSFIKIQNQLRIFHWQTRSYAQHKAFGEAYDSLGDLFDDFIEIFMGKYGTMQGDITYKIELTSYSGDYLESINNFILFFEKLSEELDPKDTDLLNLRDEMLAVLNKLKYLLTLS